MCPLRKAQGLHDKVDLSLGALEAVRRAPTVVEEPLTEEIYVPLASTLRHVTPPKRIEPPD
jgi:hypothetical protein